MTPKILFSISTLSLSIALSGCGEVRKSFGLDREGPDEFSVTPTQPLEAPTSEELLKPQPGALHPSAVLPRQKAMQALWGVTQPIQIWSKHSPLENEFLARLGNPTSEAREALIAEAYQRKIEDAGFIDRMLSKVRKNRGKDAINADKELKRLQKKYKHLKGKVS